MTFQDAVLDRAGDLLATHWEVAVWLLAHVGWARPGCRLALLHSLNVLRTEETRLAVALCYQETGDWLLTCARRELAN